jgi:hypothetical protein
LKTRIEDRETITKTKAHTIPKASGIYFDPASVPTLLISFPNIFALSI